MIGGQIKVAKMLPIYLFSIFIFTGNNSAIANSFGTSVMNRPDLIAKLLVDDGNISRSLLYCYVDYKYMRDVFSDNCDKSVLIINNKATEFGIGIMLDRKDDLRSRSYIIPVIDEVVKILQNGELK